MSLKTRLDALILTIGAECKSIRTLAGITQLPSRTITQLNSITPSLGLAYFCSDEVTAAGLGAVVLGDGTFWRRARDGKTLGSFVKFYSFNSDFYTSLDIVTFGTISVSGIRAYKWIPKEAQSFIQMTFEVTTLNASGLCRAAIYTGDQIQPLVKVASTEAEFSCATVGLKNVVFSAPYKTEENTPLWIVVLSNSITQVLRGFISTSCPIVNTISGASGARNIVSAAQVYGVMPTNFPAGAYSSGVAPACIIKSASSL